MGLSVILISLNRFLKICLFKSYKKPVLTLTPTLRSDFWI